MTVVERGPEFVVIRFVRGLYRAVARAVGVVLLIPVLALIPAAVMERGPSGGVRTSLFPAALVVLDPFLWDCSRNSLINAAVVSIGSLLVGTILARVAGRWRFWGRTLLSALVIAPIAVSPFFGALGLRLLFGRSRPWYEVWSTAGMSPDLREWVGLAWVDLAVGVPMIMLATMRGLARIDPGWEAAGRLAGLSRWGAWRRLAWPMVRPQVMRTLSLLFTVILVEPGAPLILGLRRTLAFQIIEAVSAPEPSARAALLALTTLLYVLLAWTFLRWWGGESLAYPASVSQRPESAGVVRTVLFWGCLAGATVLLWLPLYGLLGSAIRIWADPGSHDSRSALTALTDLTTDFRLRDIITRSVAVGSAVVAVTVFAAKGLASAGAGSRSGWSILANWSRGVPPIVVGVGALSVSPVLGLVSQLARRTRGIASLSDPLGWVSNALDVYRAPSVLVFLAVAAVHLPRLVQRAVWKERLKRDAPVSASRMLGLPGWRGPRVDAWPEWRSGMFGIVWSFVLATTNLAPALILQPTGAGRTIAPKLLALADQPGHGLEHAVSLASCVLIVQLLAFAAVMSGRAPSTWLDEPGDVAVY